MSTALAPSARFALDAYQIAVPDELLTPALLVYPDAVDANIAVTVGLLGGRADRWRPHIKTVKLAWVMGRLLAAGVTRFKCATTLELATLCELGAPDALLAFPVVGANARRARDLAAAYPATRVSVLVDHPAQLAQWRGGRVAVFLDLNPGMDRTGATPAEEVAVALARAAAGAGLPLAGVHWYDGHLGGVPLLERYAVAHSGYDRLLELVAALEAAGVPVPEVITSGTPAFPCAIDYAPLVAGAFTHTVSPGTLTFGDLMCLGDLPAAWGYRPAALVLAAVVSAPRAGRVTCDGGHKAVSADAGVPTCAVLGHPDWVPAKPSEEHLPIDLPTGAAPPPIGSHLYLLPRHICPTVNNFDGAALVAGGRVLRMEPVSARGHELRRDQPKVGAAAH